MEILKASYVISSPTYKACPKPDRPEYAFIGRSNVGKSSLINMLCGHEGLAKISRTPGKTQLINHFAIESSAGAPQGRPVAQWYIVDLPGYGFAKVSQSTRNTWEKMIEDYVRYRENLGNLFVLIDSRHSPQAPDLEFLRKLGSWQVPFALVFTKTDKTTQREVAANVSAFLEALKAEWERLPPHYTTSAVKKTGRKAILESIAECNALFAIDRGASRPAESQAGTTSRKPLP